MQKHETLHQYTLIYIKKIFTLLNLQIKANIHEPYWVRPWSFYSATAELNEK